MKNVRAVFTKKNRARYISHLDLMRCMQRAINRAGVNVWITEGFNPHAYLTFSLPLSLGVDSECETMDFKLPDNADFNQFKAKMNEVLPEGIEILNVYEYTNKPKLIKYSVYNISLQDEVLSVDSIEKSFHEFIAQDAIVAQKKTKKGISEVDLKPSIEVKFDFKSEGSFCVSLKLPAGVTLNINPNLVLKEFYAFIGKEIDFVKIVRVKVLNENLEEFV